MIDPNEITQNERNVMNGLWRKFLKAGTILSITAERNSEIRSAAISSEILSQRLVDHMNGVTRMVQSMPLKQQQDHLAYLARELG